VISDVLNVRTVDTLIVLMTVVGPCVEITTIGDFDLHCQENRYFHNQKFIVDSVGQEGISEDVSLVMIILARLSHGEREDRIPVFLDEISLKVTTERIEICMKEIQSIHTTLHGFLHREVVPQKGWSTTAHLNDLGLHLEVLLQNIVPNTLVHLSEPHQEVLLQTITVTPTVHLNNLDLHLEGLPLNVVPNILVHLSELHREVLLQTTLVSTTVHLDNLDLHTEALLQTTTVTTTVHLSGLDLLLEVLRLNMVPNTLVQLNIIHPEVQQDIARSMAFHLNVLHLEVLLQIIVLITVTHTNALRLEVRRQNILAHLNDFLHLEVLQQIIGLNALSHLNDTLHHDNPPTGAKIITIARIKILGSTILAYNKNRAMKR